MYECDVAVIADHEIGLAFKSVGLEPLYAETRDEISTVLKEASRKYKVIYIAECLAQHVSDLLAEYSTQTLPIIIEIPSAEGSIGLGKKKMKRITERAVGADILFKEE